MVIWNKKALWAGVCAVCAVAGAGSGGCGAAIAQETIANASFEDVEGSRVAQWTSQTWGGKARFEPAEMGHEGQRSVKVVSDEGADAGWVGGALVEPYSTYRFSARVKTEKVAPSTGKGALIALPGFGATTAVTGTADWTAVELTLDTGGDDFVPIHCVLGGGGLATGTAWFDDLQLERVSTRELSPRAVVDGSDTGPAISKYIYGQFIEHLGHCIYGGIWAEMLEDRKFFYRVGAADSPWRVYLGVQPPGQKLSSIPGTVRMSPEDAYAGEHAACVTISGKPGPVGIRQEQLALRQGKEYVGRVVVKGEASAGPVEVRLIWGNQTEARHAVTLPEIGAEYRTYLLRFTAGGDTDNGRLEVVGYGAGRFCIGAVSLMPADNVNGMRPDTLALIQELAAPVYRWPGGNFVSGYDWRDGLGDPDRRAPRKNPAWKGVEHNDFGLDEFLTFCREVGAEPYIAVNSGLGDARRAAEEVEYANGAADTPMGTLRARNGHPEPYKVHWWGIGNEMYGSWQLGHMPLADYVKKHIAFAEAMRGADPDIALVAVGASGEWSRTMLTECAGYMDLLSEHIYCGESPGVMSHIGQLARGLRSRAETHRQYHREIPALAGKTIPIAMDEWNYWYGPEVFGEIGVRYFLKDALGVAAGLHEFFRNSDVFQMANYAQTVNVIGAIKTTRTAAAFDTTGLALKLYRARFGTTPVRLQGDTSPLDVAAAWREDRRALTIGVVNPMRRGYRLELEMRGVGLSGAGRVWTLSGPDPGAYNEPGKPPSVQIAETPLSGVANVLDVPAFSVSVYELETASR